MKSKQLAILLLLAAVLGGAVWILKQNNSDTWSEKTGGAGGKVIELPINDVSRLAIRSSAGTVNLVKKDDAWTVQERANFPADFERVGGLLRKVWDLKTVQTLQAGPSQFAKFDLVEPEKGAGTRIEFNDKDGKPLGALLVGKKFMKKAEGMMADMGGFPAGRYVLPAGASTVSLVSDSLDDVDAKPEAWLKHDFIKIENPSSVTLAGATAEQKWKLTRDTAAGEWKLVGAKAAEKVDAAKVSQVASAFSFGAFSDVLNPDAKPADTGLDKPTVLTFETFDHFTYVLKVGKPNGENQPMTVGVAAQLAKERTPGKDEKPEDKTRLDEEFKATLKRLEEKLAAEKKLEGRPFLIAKSTLDSVIKDRAALLADKSAEPATGNPPPPGHPGVSSTPPLPKGHVPISVTTPPIAIPPAQKPPVAKPPVAKPAATKPSVAKPAISNPAKPARPGLIGAEPPIPPANPDKPASSPDKITPPANTKVPAAAPRPGN